MDFLPISAFTVFLAIAAVGFIYLIVAAMFGEIFDFFDHDVDMDHGPGILSSRVIAVFITTFGGIGALGVHYGLSPVVASLLGALAGFGFAGLMAVLGRFLYKQQASSDVIASDLLGQTCRVIVGIPANGIGQIRCRVGEELVDKIAQSKDGSAIAENATVRVESVLGETVVVTRF